MQGLLALQRYFDFSGRSARAEYWQFTGMFFIGACLTFLLDLAIGGPEALPTLTLILILVAIVPAYAVAVRRLHDRGRSGKWAGAQAAAAGFNIILVAAYQKAQFTPFGDALRLVGRGTSPLFILISLFLLYQFLKRGDEGINQYGPDPLDNPEPAPRIAELVTKAQNAAANATTNVAPRPAPQSRRPVEGDPLEQIERLAKLRDAGLLTEAEFSEQKAAYLSRL